MHCQQTSPANNAERESHMEMRTGLETCGSGNSTVRQTQRRARQEKSNEWYSTLTFLSFWFAIHLVQMGFFFFSLTLTKLVVLTSFFRWSSLEFSQQGYVGLFEWGGKCLILYIFCKSRWMGFAKLMARRNEKRMQISMNFGKPCSYPCATISFLNV